MKVLLSTFFVIISHYEWDHVNPKAWRYEVHNIGKPAYLLMYTFSRWTLEELRARYWSSNKVSKIKNGILLSYAYKLLKQTPKAKSYPMKYESGKIGTKETNNAGNWPMLIRETNPFRAIHWKLNSQEFTLSPLRFQTPSTLMFSLIIIVKVGDLPVTFQVWFSPPRLFDPRASAISNHPGLSKCHLKCYFRELPDLLRKDAFPLSSLMSCPLFCSVCMWAATGVRIPEQVNRCSALIFKWMGNYVNNCVYLFFLLEGKISVNCLTHLCPLACDSLVHNSIFRCFVFARFMNESWCETQLKPSLRKDSRPREQTWLPDGIRMEGKGSLGSLGWTCTHCYMYNG